MSLDPEDEKCPAAISFTRKNKTNIFRNLNNRSVTKHKLIETILNPLLPGIKTYRINCQNAVPVHLNVFKMISDKRFKCLCGPLSVCLE